MMQWLLTHTPLLYFTQSLWRDEAFSILVAQRPLSFFFAKLTFEPPVYYTLLHFWMKLFGESEVAARSLSFVAFAGATWVVIAWSEKLFKKHFLSWFVPLLFFFNPMLLYYAFEVRTYAWFILFTVLSLSTYVNKRWVWYVVATVLGFYTHTYFIFVPLVQGLHFLITVKKRHALFKQPAFRSFTAILVFIAPWIVRIARETTRLKSSWYYPVDFHLIRSVLGNMFVGYEGTPWYLWPYTAWLSLVLLILFVIALRAKTRAGTTRLFFLLAVVPLTLVIGISFVKPLFVNRYLLPVTVAEVFLVAFAIEAMRHRLVQKLFAATMFLFTLGFNLWYPSLHPKLNIRSTMTEINMLRDSDDVILAASPLVFFESIYYSGEPGKVFLYNPTGSPFPWYVGDAIVSDRQIVRDFPPYPIRAFLVHENGDYEIAYETSSARTLVRSESD